MVSFNSSRRWSTWSRRRSGPHWDRGLRDLTGGGIVAVVEADAGQEPRVYLLITPKDLPLLERTQQVLMKLAREDAKNKAKPDPVRTSDHKGVVVYAVGGDKGAAYAIISGKLAISNSPKSLMRLIDEHLETRSAGDPGGASKSKRARIGLPISPSGERCESARARTSWPGATPIWTS